MRFWYFAALALAFAFAAVANACGGAADSDLLAPPAEGGTADASQDAGGKDSSSDAADAQETAPPDPGINCPDAGTCTVPGQICCRDNSSGSPVYACTSNDCPGLAIPCDDSADCAKAGHPGDVCCLSADQSGNAALVVCRPLNECVGIPGRTPVCDPKAPSDCPKGTTCQPSTQTLPGFDICRQ